MLPRILRKDAFEGFVEFLMGKYRVFAPVAKGPQQTHSRATGIATTVFIVSPSHFSWGSLPHNHRTMVLRLRPRTRAKAPRISKDTVPGSGTTVNEVELSPHNWPS